MIYIKIKIFSLSLSLSLFLSLFLSVSVCPSVFFTLLKYFITLHPINSVLARFWRNWTHDMFEINEQDEVSVFMLNARTNSRYSRYCGFLRCRRCTAYYTALVSHAMRHRNRVQDTSWQSQEGETGGSELSTL